MVNRTNELRKFVINSREEKEQSLPDDMDRKQRNVEVLKAEQGSLDFIMEEAFAIVKETCRRMDGASWRVSGQEIIWEMVPYDVQLFGELYYHNARSKI